MRKYAQQCWRRAWRAGWKGVTCGWRGSSSRRHSLRKKTEEQDCARRRCLQRRTIDRLSIGFAQTVLQALPEFSDGRGTSLLFCGEGGWEEGLPAWRRIGQPLLDGEEAGAQDRGLQRGHIIARERWSTAERFIGHDRQRPQI